MQDEVRDLCETTTYLSIGVLKALDANHLYQDVADHLGGHCGIVDRMIDYAEYHQEWFTSRKVDYEDFNGVYVYEIIEDRLSKWIVQYYKDNRFFPDVQALFKFMDSVKAGGAAGEVAACGVGCSRSIEL